MKTLLGGVVVSIVIGLLALSSLKEPTWAEDGSFTLRLPKFYWIIGLLCVVLGIGIVAFTIGWARSQDQFPAALSAIMVFGLGLPLYAKGAICRVTVSENGVHERTMFGREKFVKWEDVLNVSFGNISKELKIASPGTKIKVHEHMIGFQELVAKVEAKTSFKRRELDIPG